MPTPFTHLHVAQRWLADPDIPTDHREFLNAQRSAFLLGSVAADARVGGGMDRAATHFYAYDAPLVDHAWLEMLRRFPALSETDADAQRAFVAGYVGHISMDEVWTLEMLGPYFGRAEWGDRVFRFFMLHIILIYMDERDYAHLCDWQRPTLATAEPDGWTPFMPDDVLRGWRDLIARQLPPDGRSETLDIFGGRINRTPDDFRAVLDSPERMQADLWAHIPRDALAQVEDRMYTFARQQMIIYLDGVY